MILKGEDIIIMSRDDANKLYQLIWPIYTRNRKKLEKLQRDGLLTILDDLRIAVKEEIAD
ncbi:MAG: hypothetical protein M0R17_01865 [Candidatus Omnitrophica bacterium]|jgi:hypothetical protein|nr:hypothetical protein [Candidatus Omnitrophota bacterium]